MENNEKKPAVSLFAEDIQWDVDARDIELPSTVEIPEDVWKRQNDDDNAISNWLSDEYEFCHGGYKLEWKMSDERCRELLNKMVAYVGDHSVSLFEQVSVLQANGFTDQDLLALGFDEGVLG